MPVAALHNLVPGRWGLAGQRALLVDLEAAFLVDQGAGAERQGGETLVALAAFLFVTGAALTYTVMLLLGRGLYFLHCRRFK